MFYKRAFYSIGASGRGSRESYHERRDDSRERASGMGILNFHAQNFTNDPRVDLAHV